MAIRPLHNSTSFLTLMCLPTGDDCRKIRRIDGPLGRYSLLASGKGDESESECKEAATQGTLMFYHFFNLFWLISSSEK